MKRKLALAFVALTVLVGASGAQAAQAYDPGEYYFFSNEGACLGAMDRMARSGFVITHYCTYQLQQGSNLPWFFAAR
ncbi:hypothetical protein [Luethyella okanaganae]|uniref:Secreted protein n=1 Tax=Luethyella okanaganae TaxID=69372 RepID=A0ABW1VFF6_9MICO